MDEKLASIVAMDRIYVASDVYRAIAEARPDLAGRVEECKWLEPGTVLGMQDDFLVSRHTLDIITTGT